MALYMCYTLAHSHGLTKQSSAERRGKPEVKVTKEVATKKIMKGGKWSESYG